MQQIASQNAPSANIVIPHFAFGSLAWLTATLLIAFSPDAFTAHYFNPKLLAITHLLVLGWISMIIFGALYQLIPVILDVKLFSEKLALFSFFTLAAGSLLLCFTFWNFLLGSTLHLASTLIITAVLSFAFNLFKTARNSQNKSIERDFILTSVLWLLFTVLAGFTFALNLKYAFLKPEHLKLLRIHAHAGLAGWFLQLIIGVGSRLLPMFMVAHNLNKKKLKTAYYCINIGLVLSISSFYLNTILDIIFTAVLLISGVFYFLLYLKEAYTKRVKKNLDTGMKQSVLSFASLLLACVISFILLFFSHEGYSPRLAIAYGSLIIIGFISSLILGQSFKTLPFIIWLKVYKKLIGKIKMPLPKELYSEKLLNLQLYLFFAGFFHLLLGIILCHQILVTMAGALLSVSALLYTLNTFKIILHKPQHHEKTK